MKVINSYLLFDGSQVIDGVPVKKMQKKELICLGIETSAHTFGVGIVDGTGKILGDEKNIYKPKPGRGILPAEAAEYHFKNAKGVIQNALSSAKLRVEDIDVFSFTQGPGLPPCLRVGANVSRYMASRLGKPLVGVNHCVAHIEIGKLTSGAKDPVILYLSGGNTQVVSFAEGYYRIFGETEDVPIGNVVDVLARELKMQMPGGPQIEKLAVGGVYIELPYIVKGMDLSFSGITTEAVRKLRSGVGKKDISYSVQETCFAMLTEVSERALAHIGKGELLLVGGVAANKRLREMVRIMCEERGTKFYVVSPEYSGDNGVMIAWTGFLAYKSGEMVNIENSRIKQKWRTDEVEITWMPG